MERLLTLKSKDFLTGLSGGAHIGTGGIFYKADGITPLYEAGATQSANNGLLMAGAAATTVSGSLTGTITCSCRTSVSGNDTAYFGTSSGHIFSLVLDTGFATSLTDLHTASSAILGMEIFVGNNGGRRMLYWTETNIGTYNLAATFNDTAYTISSDFVHAPHKYFDKILYGNGVKVGAIYGDGGAGLTNDTNVLDVPLTITDISDDGIYAVIAVTDNFVFDPSAMSDTRVLFWDGFSTSWNREHAVPDPVIYALEKTPLGVFAYGVTGIWQVSFEGVRKVFTRSPGIYSTTTSTAIPYGRTAASHYGDALLWGGTSGSNKVIKTFGKLDDVPAAYLHPFLSTASKNITFVDGQLLKGYVFVADDTPLLKAYPFSTANAPATGVTAQTAYFNLEEPADVQAIRVVFGEPLASGDSFGVSGYSDEDTAATSFGSIAYSATRTTRSKTLRKKLSAEDQLSLKVSFDAGAVKVKKVEVFGDVRERAD